MKKFWMLRVENGGCPSAVHSTRDSAFKRAHDLARGSGSKVAILTACEYVNPKMPEPQDIVCTLEPTEEN